MTEENEKDTVFIETTNELGMLRKIKEVVLYHKRCHVPWKPNDRYEVAVTAFERGRHCYGGALDRSKLVIISSSVNCEGMLEGIEPGKFMFPGRDAGAVLIPPLDTRRNYRENELTVCNEPGDREAAIRKAMRIADHIDELFRLYAEAAKAHKESGDA